MSENNKKFFLGDENNKTRNIIAIVCVTAIICILGLNIIWGVGKAERDIIYKSGGSAKLYSISDKKVSDIEYSYYSDKFIDFEKEDKNVFRTHFDVEVFYEAEKTDDGYDILFFDGDKKAAAAKNMSAMRFGQNGIDAIFFERNENGTYKSFLYNGKECIKISDNCTDATVCGEKSQYVIYEENGKAMFSNLKKEPFEMGINAFDASSVMLSQDERSLMLISSEERELYIYNINMVEGNTSNAVKVTDGVKYASFTSMKGDYFFVDENDKFFYSSGGYTFEEDSDIKKAEAGYDVMNIYYLKEDGSLYSFYVGDKKLIYEGAEDFYYIGARKLAIIKDGKLLILENKKVTDSYIDADEFLKYWKR